MLWWGGGISVWTPLLLPTCYCLPAPAPAPPPPLQVLVDTTSAPTCQLLAVRGLPGSSSTLVTVEVALPDGTSTNLASLAQQVNEGGGAGTVGGEGWYRKGGGARWGWYHKGEGLVPKGGCFRKGGCYRKGGMVP